MYEQELVLQAWREENKIRFALIKPNQNQHLELHKSHIKERQIRDKKKQKPNITLKDYNFSTLPEDYPPSSILQESKEFTEITVHHDDNAVSHFLFGVFSIP